jgi:glycosyltransferase involved in cell wall biosynthesis
MISYSIVVTTYNQKDTLKLALDSLSKQIKFPKAFEVIITDDASSDSIDEMIKKLRFPIFLKYISSEKNIGRSRNRNRGLQKAVGQQIIFIDGDMVPDDSFIESYIKAWQQFPESVILGSWKPRPDLKISRWQRYFLSRGRLAMKQGARVPGKYFTSGNFSIPKKIIDTISGFDTSFDGWGGEDTDFGFRLEAADVPIYFIPAAGCKHHHNKSLSETIVEYQKFGQSGYPQLLNKYPGKVVFDKGWLFGLPDSLAGIFKKSISYILFPLRTGIFLSFLKLLAMIGDGVLFTDPFFDLLFYGNLARGYRKRPK